MGDYGFVCLIYSFRLLATRVEPKKWIFFSKKYRYIFVMVMLFNDTCTFFSTKNVLKKIDLPFAQKKQLGRQARRCLLTPSLDQNMTTALPI
jgi:hypothetical protein